MAHYINIITDIQCILLMKMNILHFFIEHIVSALLDSTVASTAPSAEGSSQSPLLGRFKVLRRREYPVEYLKKSIIEQKCCQY